MVPVPVQTPDGRHQGVFYAAQDYLALGEFPDFFRLPLTPISAQRIANQLGLLLPTSKMVDAIWKASGVRLTPEPLVPNKGANLAQFDQHSKAIDAQLVPRSAGFAQVATPNAPYAGQKKDIILSNIWKPGKVVIYGWHKPDGSHIQPKSNVHGDFYVDYSHGVRLISPTMLVDGVTRNVADVMKDPNLFSLLSDESAPLIRTSYPTGNGADVIAANTSPSGRIDYAGLGTSVLVALEALHPAFGGTGKKAS